MAEMTAKQAIAVLHNNQYQKHIANGEYDYIHPLTDAECKGIESLIQQQQQQIEQLQGQATFDSSQLAEYETMIREMANKIEQLKCCEGVRCPFCDEDDFDKTGLSMHLLMGHCDNFPPKEAQ